MSALSLPLTGSNPVAARARANFEEQNQHVLRRTDRMFASLLLFQWLASILVALIVSPRTWAGALSATHPHVYVALLLGGAITSLPVWLALRWPGRTLTRHTIAIAQMLTSALLIHLTGGRIETHFHVFGSLTFLAFYRDWRVLLTGTIVVAADHLLRGYFWPQSAYGVLTGAEWRWLEHAGWVLFLDFFWVNSCLQSRREMWGIAERQAELEDARETVERKVHERTAELEASEAHTRAILESALDCIITIDHEGKIVDFNPAAEQTFGHRNSEVLGKDLSDLLIPPDLRGQHHAGMQNYLATGVGPMLGKRREVHAVRAGGEQFLAEIAVVAVQQQGPPRFTAFLRDISEQRRAEEQLRLQARVLESMSEGVVLTNESGLILYANAAEESMFGYGPGELVGQHVTVMNAYPPEENLRLVRSVIEQLQTRGSWSGEFRNRRKDGSEFTSYARIAGMELRNRKVWVCVQEDITDRKRADAELRQAKEAAEASNRAKSEFLANMSHEIRTPMNGILGMTDLLLESELMPDQRESLGMVKTSADALLTIINDILDFSKIEAGKLSLEVEEFNLRDAVGDALKSLALRAHRKGLELTYHVADEAPEFVVGDSVRVGQILLNLVSNAIKFTERGEVVVNIAVVPPPAPAVKGPRPGEVELHFTITDTGIGIPPEKLRKIFDPFTQADGSTTRRYGGTGLGLTICACLVKLMQGRIWVESEVGKGSQFHFQARLGLAAATPSREIRPPPAVLRGLSILVVDDNATNSRILDQMLRTWGMRPTGVQSGSAALAELRSCAARGQAYPLVLLDFVMPEMDGLELAQAIQQQPELAGVTLMMLSSANRPEDLARCRALGLQAYLIKPIRPSDLQSAILRALQPRQPKCDVLPLTQPTLQTGGVAAAGLRILLAEDNAVNQRVVVHLLEKRGHQVVVAGNGKEALTALSVGPGGFASGFDIVLMDVQMPEMGGFEATAAIRAWENGGGQRIPIIALTAHAMKGDRERCLEAGMDDYVGKPIQQEQLMQSIAKLTQPATATAAPPGPRAAAEAFDRASALQHVDGDETILAELVELFQQDRSRLLQSIRTAVTERNGQALNRAAHALKGSLVYLGAAPACAAARQLETLGADNDLMSAKSVLVVLETALERLEVALNLEFGGSRADVEACCLTGAAGG